MAKRLWEQITVGTDIKLWIDPEPYNKTDLQDERDRLQAIKTSPLECRTELAVCKGYPSVADYDDFIQDEIDEIKDLIDYFGYSTKVTNLTVMDGEWFTPTDIESVSNEDVGNEAVNAVDGNNVTFWRSSNNEVHEIIFKLRTYPKKISKFRIWYASGESARERLNDIDVHAANALGNLDEPQNILETGINLTWTAGGGVWVEHTLASKKNKCKYIKFVIGNTDNGNNQAQMREIEFWVETRDPT